MRIDMKKAPMGWNSYDYYDTTVNEDQIRANALYMAEHLKEYGWEYIVVDIQWYAKDAGSMRDQFQYVPFGNHEIDEFGRLQPDTGRFPSAASGKGFRPLADYVHSLGLKFGIHIMRGVPREAAHKHLPIYGSQFSAHEVADPTSICPWNPDMYGTRKNCAGSQDYYDSIVKMYADWGVDFIKCDDICNSYLFPGDEFNGWDELEKLHTAIEKTEREIVLSLSPGPAQLERAWKYKKCANMWRITDDFWDSWDSLLNMFHRCELWQDHVSSGAYPDCDMLPLGRVGKGFGEERLSRFSQEEQKTMMTLWCIFGSPLMMGGELTLLDEETLKLLSNTELLKLVENEYHGRQELRTEDYIVWSNRHENSDEVVIAIFNLKETEQEIHYDISIDCLKQDQTVCLKELWENKIYEIQDPILNSIVPAHGVKVYKLFA